MVCVHSNATDVCTVTCVTIHMRIECALSEGMQLCAYTEQLLMHEQWHGSL